MDNSATENLANPGAEKVKREGVRPLFPSLGKFLGDNRKRIDEAIAELDRGLIFFSARPTVESLMDPEGGYSYHFSEMPQDQRIGVATRIVDAIQRAEAENRSFCRNPVVLKERGIDSDTAGRLIRKMLMSNGYEIDEAACEKLSHPGYDPLLDYYNIGQFVHPVAVETQTGPTDL